MRKLIVSLFTIIAFVGYAFGQRFTGHANPTLPVSQAQTGQANSAPSQGSNAPVTSATGSVAYRNGTYTGQAEANQWGSVQVQVTISGGKVSNVQFLQVPQERRRSQAINSQATPMLQSEAIQAQSANVNIISGATLTSESFQQSLESALVQASA
jgi:uncharacterized protein with FMN-binding domain